MKESYKALIWYVYSFMYGLRDISKYENVQVVEIVLKTR